MEKEFDYILQDDESIKWINGVNKRAYILTKLRLFFFIGLIPHAAFAGLVTFPYCLVLLFLSVFNVIPLWIGLAHISLAFIVWIVVIGVISKMAKKIYFCVTNKRIILKTGIFAPKFVHHPLKNVGTIKVDGNIFDSEKDPRSATLTILVTTFHHAGKLDFLKISCLNNAYDAYKFLSKEVEGNNEYIRVKTETNQ